MDPSDRSAARIDLSSPWILWCVLSAIVLVNIANALAVWFRPWERTGRAGVETARWLLLTEENNPSTWLAALLLAIAAGLAAMTSFSSPRDSRRGWWVTANVLLLLSLDEAASLHERLDDVIGIDGDDVATYAWLLPGSVILVVLGILFVRFLRSVDRSLRSGLLLAALLFFGGAVGFEAVAGWWDGRHGDENVTYHLISAVEENLELVGAVVWIVALAQHARREIGVIELRFGPSDRSDAH